MSIKRTVLILMYFYFIGVIYSTDDVIRKGKFLGITGFLSGSANGFHLAPFLRQWNALLQVNVEKNRHHGVFVIPASSLYYPPYGGGYGLYSPYNPYNLGEIGGGGGGLLQPNLLRPSLFDDYKQQVSTSTLTPFNTDPSDKPKFELITNNELNDPWDDQSIDGQTVEPDPNVSVFNLNVRDDRKTHKRDIEHKNQTDGEAVVATVVEITEMATEATTTTAPTSAIELLVQTTTDNPEMQTIAAAAEAPTTTPAPTTPISIPSASTSTQPPSPSTTSTSTSTTTTENAPAQSGFQPILNVYYGGSPNEYSNYVYFTTSEPAENLEAPTEKPQIASDRNDFGKFRPSIQYEYRNYRYNPDSHFVPIVGAKQIF